MSNKKIKKNKVLLETVQNEHIAYFDLYTSFGHVGLSREKYDRGDDLPLNEVGDLILRDLVSLYLRE